MNNTPPKNMVGLIATLIFVVLLIVGGITAILMPKPKSDDDSSYLQSTTITSPVSKTTDSIAIDLDSGDSNANADSVKQLFKVFGVDNLNLPTIVKTKLKDLLPTALQQQVTPTYPVTFVHINPDSISCDKDVNCTMSLYIDSPEMYFNLNFSKVTGRGYVPKLIQTSWEGVTQ